MRCITNWNLVLRRAAVLAALLLMMSPLLARGCRSCDFNFKRRYEENTEPIERRALFKKDIFMSRGWGAGGGNAFTSRSNSDLAKKTQRIVELLWNEPKEITSEPRVDYLRSSNRMPKPSSSRRHIPIVIPQLFISSGWGPLGK